MNPKVIVLILSFNGKYLLDDSVESYLANDYDNFEIVVIDNSSIDGTKEYVEQKWPKVKVLRTEKNLKYSGGFNYGLKYAFEQEKADYVLITNNDVKADVNVIKATVKVAEDNSNAAFVTGKVYYYYKPNTIQTVGKCSHDKYWRMGQRGTGVDTGQYDEVTELAWCDDIFWLVTKKVYTITGGYDTEFEFQAEDFDWQARAKKVGFKIYYTPYAKIWHKDSMTIGKKSAFKAYYDFRNPLIVHMKHRTFNEYKHYYHMKRINLLKQTVKGFAKLRIWYVYKCWKGFFSAIRWGLKNNRISLWKLFF